MSLIPEPRGLPEPERMTLEQVRVEAERLANNYGTMRSKYLSRVIYRLLEVTKCG